MRRTHGMAHCAAEGRKQASIYRIWANIKQRCYNPNSVQYKNYGGRGITMCAAWKNSFKAFYRDVGDRPDGLTLDRKNNDRGYTPKNVRWATVAEQNHNSRRCVMIKFDGASKPINVWCREFGIPYTTYKQRRRNGWEPVRACTTPPNPRHQKKNRN